MIWAERENNSEAPVDIALTVPWPVGNIPRCSAPKTTTQEERSIRAAPQKVQRAQDLASAAAETTPKAAIQMAIYLLVLQRQ